MPEYCNCNNCINSPVQEEECLRRRRRRSIRSKNATFWRNHQSASDAKSGHHERTGGCSCKQGGRRKPFCDCYASKLCFSGRYQWLNQSLYESNEIDHFYNFSYNEGNIVNDMTDGHLLQLLQDDKGIYVIFNQ